MLLSLAAAAPAAAQQVVTSSGPEAVSVTVYRNPNGDRMDLEWLSGYALITETRTVSLPAGASVIHQENNGLAAARNAGFKAARTEIVLPLDCDDVLEPTFLAEAMALLKAAPPQVAFVYSHIKLTGGRFFDWVHGNPTVCTVS